jgi:hypothetical protein
MKTFENLEEIWNKQPEPPSFSALDIEYHARRQAKAIKVKHQWTIIIISLTVLVLVAYFTLKSAYRNQMLFIGLGIMITMLLLRIILEYVSIRKLNALSAETSFMEYVTKLKDFYQWRKKIHLVLTPIVYGCYIVGFILLLPVFKTSFPTGFFWYITISGFVFFVVFSFFMARQILKELKILYILKKNAPEASGRGISPNKEEDVSNV